MPKTGAETRTQILDAAQELILQQGFAATSLDAILDRLDLTKGAFFHHFRSKGELATALIERFAQADAAMLDRTIGRAERLSRDPVQQLLIVVGLLEEEAGAMTDANPGCLFASYCYEAQLFDAQTHTIIERALVYWRERLGALIRAAVAHRTPRLEVEVDDLADMLTVVAEGAYILSRTTKDPQALARQFRQYRNYLELLFGET